MPIATKSDFINLSSEKKTEELAKKISKKLKLGHVVFFVGEMGVGKTTFIRYLINNFQKQNGLKITEVTSPTFNLLNEYQIKRIKINHYDLFRINTLNEILEVTTKPIIYDGDTGEELFSSEKDHEQSIFDAVFSLDETLVITTSRDRTLKVWNLITRTEFGQSMKHNAETWRGAFRRCGKELQIWE